MSLVGKEVEELVAPAVVNKSILEAYSLLDLRGKYVILFFYPLDFTFVCPTELHAFQDKYSEFKERDCEVVGCSVDSVYSHFAWTQVPKKQGGIEGVEFPLVADLKKSFARAFGVLNEEKGVAYRGLFLIDKEGIVRHETVNDLNLGRNIDEALRMLDALQFVEAHGEVCPANWHKGEKAMRPDSRGLKDYFAG